MAPAEGSLGFGSDEQHAAVAVEVPGRNEPRRDFSRLLPRREVEPVQPFGPGVLADLAFLQAQGEQLLRVQMPWGAWRGDGFDVALAPQQQQPAGLQELVLGDGEQQRIAGLTRSTSGAAEALQERRDGARCADLNNPVEIADVYAKFEGRGRDDDAVAVLGERRLRAAPLVE